MYRRGQQIRVFAAGLLCLLALAGAARAQVGVTAAVTYDGMLYHYDYSVINGLPNDPNNVLAIVTVGATGVQNLMAPTGFVANFDPGLNLLSFLEDADPATPQTFAPGTTVTGFTFDTPTPQLLTAFEALDAAGQPHNGQTIFVPEPGTLALALAAVPGGLFLIRRRRIAAAS